MIYLQKNKMFTKCTEQHSTQTAHCRGLTNIIKLYFLVNKLRNYKGCWLLAINQLLLNNFFVNHKTTKLQNSTIHRFLWT